MTHAREFRLTNAAFTEQRSHWWDGSQARLTIPAYLQEDHPHECTCTD